MYQINCCHVLTYYIFRRIWWIKFHERESFWSKFRLIYFCATLLPQCRIVMCAQSINKNVKAKLFMFYKGNVAYFLAGCWLVKRIRLAKAVASAFCMAYAVEFVTPGWLLASKRSAMLLSKSVFSCFTKIFVAFLWNTNFCMRLKVCWNISKRQFNKSLKIAKKKHKKNML